MNHYIIFTANIHPIGGMQTYVAGKAKFLEHKGWNVTIFFSGRNNDGGCAIKSLEKYKMGWFPEIAIPPGNWPSSMRKSTLQAMRRLLGKLDGQIIVESQASAYALWGELLAKAIEAKHFCFICNETFRGKDRFYAEYLDFFDFKHKRKELAGIHSTSISQLFDGYKDVMPEENYTFVAANEPPVQDIPNKAVEELHRADWNICYIGRIEKGYVPEVIRNVFQFSQAHLEKKVQFIFVGNEKKRSELIKNTFQEAKNVELVFLGDCVPIPRKLFDKVDVVIAGSGCAICSAYENVLTIVADAQNYRSNGILGIETFNILHCEEGREQESFEESLEKVLVQGFYTNKALDLQKLPRFDSYEKYIREHFEMIKSSNSSYEYYDVLKHRRLSHKREWILYRCSWMFKILIRKNLPHTKI